MSHKERRDDSFIKKPVYPGGNVAYRKFIKENLKYPKAALENKTEGIVFLKYSIDHKGNVIEAKVLKGIGDGCDEEAKRIVSLLKFEIPKGPRKLRVQFHKKTQITFRIPIEKPKPKPKAKPTPVAAQKMRMVYQYQPKKKEQAPRGQSQKKTYSYTISGNIKDLI